MKETFLALLRLINRNGIRDLSTYLIETDFFSAPASTLYHGVCEGGLLQHSLEVYNNLVQINNIYNLSIDNEALLICGLLHDICKANFYKKGFRNRKNEDSGAWEKVEVYEVFDQFPLGHGEKSVILLQKFVSLTDQEILAIRWHMGGFDDSVKSYGSSRSLSNAMRRYPLVTALHMADLAATYFANK